MRRSGRQPGRSPLPPSMGSTGDVLEPKTEAGALAQWGFQGPGDQGGHYAMGKHFLRQRGWKEYEHFSPPPFLQDSAGSQKPLVKKPEAQRPRDSKELVRGGPVPETVPGAGLKGTRQKGCLVPEEQPISFHVIAIQNSLTFSIFC